MAALRQVIDETPFWCDEDQMSLNPTARGRLQAEGLEFIMDFEDFKTDQLNQAIKNMRTAIPPIQGIAAVLHEDGSELFPAIPPVAGSPPVIMSAKCILRLKTASTAFHYYKSINRRCTVPNMHYKNVLKSFYVEWEALEKLC